MLRNQHLSQFDSHLLFCIESGTNDMAKSLIKRDLHVMKDALGSLLHHAALFDNHVIAEHLLELGCDVDTLDCASKTPLMTAVQADSVAVVKVLLEAHANIEFKNANGKSIVQVMFSSQAVLGEVTKLFIERLQRETDTVEMLVKRLFDAKGSMYHATFSRDTKVMKSLLDRGVDINSTDYFNRTAVHAAVDLDDLNLVEWLLENNVNVDTLDNCDNSPLYYAATDGKCDMVRILLENGANPNTANKRFDYTPLFSTYANSLAEIDQRKFDVCAELLLQHGAIPRNSSVDSNTLFDYALFVKSPTRINLLIAHLSMLDKLGKSITKSAMRCNVEAHHVVQSQLEHNYDLCWKLLGLNIFRKSSLLDLLTESVDKLRIRVRERRFISKIHYFDVNLGKMYPFYFEPLIKRIAKAEDVVKMEDVAIRVLCELFDRNYNECYIFAREVVGYLSEKDLERVCEVIDLSD